MGGTRSIAIEQALARHQRERERGGLGLSVVPVGAGAAVAAVGGWALDTGAALAIVDQAGTMADALAAIVDELPTWRLLAAARALVAAAGGRGAGEIDAALTAGDTDERAAWIARIADGRRDVALAGALLSSFAGSGTIDLAGLGAIETAAPLLIELGGPVAVLVLAGADTAEPAIATAVALCVALPRQAIAVGIDAEVLDRWLATAGGTAAASLVRQGRIVRAPEAAPPAPRPKRETIKGAAKVPMPRRRGSSPAHVEKTAASGGVRARGSRKMALIPGDTVAWPHSDSGRRLRDALERDPRTAGHFGLGAGALMVEGARAEVDLYDADLAIAVEIEGWRHLGDVDRHRRDRQRDHALERSRIFVVRVLEPDVERRLEHLVDQIAEAVAFRRAVGA